MPQGLALASSMAAPIPPMAVAAPAGPGRSYDNGLSFAGMLHVLDGTALDETAPARSAAATSAAPEQPGAPALPVGAAVQSASAGAAAQRAAVSLAEMASSGGRGGADDARVLSSKIGHPPVLPSAQAGAAERLAGDAKPAATKGRSASATARSPPSTASTPTMLSQADRTPLTLAKEKATETPASPEDIAADQRGVPLALRRLTGGRLAPTPTRLAAAGAAAVTLSAAPGIARRLQGAPDRTTPVDLADAPATTAGGDGAAGLTPGAISMVALPPPGAALQATPQPQGASADGRAAQSGHLVATPGSGLAGSESSRGTVGAELDARQADSASAGAAAAPTFPSVPAPPPPADGFPELSLSALPPSTASGPLHSTDASSATDPLSDTATPATGAGHQISAALVSLSRGEDGTQSMTLRLEPAELGQVQIRIDRAPDAPARVDIAVDRPETMTLLLRDQPQLQRALDVAGVPTDGRSLTLHLASPESMAPSAGTQGGMAANAGSGQGGSNGFGTRSGGHGSTGESAAVAPDDPEETLPRWLRAGLDITA